MYQMKYFLSVLMSLPVLYLDALGIPSYKKDSFNKVKHQFGDEWEIIDRATSIRSMWAEYEVHPYAGNKIPEWLQVKLGNNYFQRAYEISSKMSARL